MRKSLGFTLAEVLITLAIIGVVAAMTIPSVIVNTNQQEFKTGLKKAVSVLNQAITMNIALDSTSPADLTSATQASTDSLSLMGYLAKRLNIIKETTLTGASKNAAFYTSDGMRFEFPGEGIVTKNTDNTRCGNGTSGAAATDDGDVTGLPCAILVDVNGDKRPNPPASGDKYIEPTATRINDIFNIMITDTAAIPYGVIAQKTMFQND